MIIEEVERLPKKLEQKKRGKTTFQCGAVAEQQKEDIG